MISGKLPQYGYYTLPDRDLSNYTFPSKIIYIKMMTPERIIVEAKNPAEIAKKYNISSPTICDFISGKTKTCKGWELLRVKYEFDYYPEINNDQ